MAERSPQPEQAATAAEPLAFVSIVVPVRNEAAFIRKTLHALLDQDYPFDRFEVLVADGQSTDDTVLIVREMQLQYCNLRLLDNPKRWSSAGRNQAIRAASGDYYVVVDGHCDLPGPDYLRRLVETFETSGADCLGRPQPLDVAGASPVQQAIAVARSCWLGHHPESHIYSQTAQWVRPQSVAVAYQRSVFERVGLFDETFDACEDVEFNHRVDRAGLRCWFAPALTVRYHPRSNLRGLFRQMIRYGRGRWRLLRKHPETFSWPCLAPAAWVAGLVVGPICASLSTALAGLYIGALGCYLLTVALVSLALSVHERNLRLLGWLPFVFAAIHCGAGTGLLQEAAAGWFTWQTDPPAVPRWPALPITGRSAGTVPCK